MTNELIVELGSQLVVGVALIATMKASQANLEKRVDKVENCIEEMPKNYVPRTEVERALSGIEAVTKQTNSMVQALVYAGGNKDVARQALG